MRPIYVGDARNIRKRLRQHQSGNVEASALRKHIAEAMGYRIRREKRQSGSYRKRLDLPDPKVGESKISRYILSGGWRFVVCTDYKEANQLQWFLIAQLMPVLNVDSRSWDQEHRVLFEFFQRELERQAVLKLRDIGSREAEGAGVYVLYHSTLPHEESEEV